MPALQRQYGSLLLDRWHLLSLDAPTVAVLWTWFIATVVHLRLPAAALAAMALAVWTLYAADRLLDARQLTDQPLQSAGLEPRHLFHHRHRSTFHIGIGVAAISLAATLPLLYTEAIHLYLILGGLLAGYFILIHATQHARRLPKEIAVGLFFAAATFIPTVAHRPELRLALLLPAVLFAALCSLNCLFIYAWEHSRTEEARLTHPVTRIALRCLRPLGIALMLAATAVASFDRHAPWPLSLACALSALGLLLLDRNRRRIASTTLRAAADLALTTPAAIAAVPAAPMNPKQSPKPVNFDRIARPYRWLEYLTLGPALQRCRTHFLPNLQHRRHALVLGDGDGRFLAQLLLTNQHLRADAVDTSAAMLHLLSIRCAAAQTRLHTHHHSALEHAPAASTLDCLTQSELDALAQPHGAPRPAQRALARPPTSASQPARYAFPRGSSSAASISGLPHPHRTANQPAPRPHRGSRQRRFSPWLPVKFASSDCSPASCGNSRHGKPVQPSQRCSFPDANPIPEKQEPPPLDPIPNPEPISPSLDEPDPGVFHHDPQPPRNNCLNSQPHHFLKCKRNPPALELLTFYEFIYPSPRSRRNQTAQSQPRRQAPSR